MQALIESGRIVELMLAFIALEIAILGYLRLKRGMGPRLPAMLVNIGAGSCIMLALYCAQRDAAWQWIAMWLVLSLLCHVSDLFFRWRQALPANPAADREHA